MVFGIPIDKEYIILSLYWVAYKLVTQEFQTVNLGTFVDEHLPLVYT